MSEPTLAQKLLTVQTKIGAVARSSTNPHFKSKYADLNEVLEVAKAALNAEGIFISQAPGVDASGVQTVRYVETSLIDASSGQQISGRVAFSGAEDNMQKIGAAITYARRFGLVSLLALESEDDDGESAVGRGSQGAKATAKGPASVSTVGAASDRVGSVSKQPAPAVPGASRETLLKTIKLTGKTLIDSKRASKEEAEGMLALYGVKDPAELNVEQMGKLLTQLEARLK